jgi:hypothetical protein
VACENSRLVLYCTTNILSPDFDGYKWDVLGMCEAEREGFNVTSESKKVRF